MSRQHSRRGAPLLAGKPGKQGRDTPKGPEGLEARQRGAARTSRLQGVSTRGAAIGASNEAPVGCRYGPPPDADGPPLRGMVERIEGLMAGGAAKRSWFMVVVTVLAASCGGRVDGGGGDGSSSGGQDGASPGSEASTSCLADGAYCDSGSQCCGGACLNGSCSRPGCLGYGRYCTSTQQCCDGSCVSQLCSGVPSDAGQFGDGGTSTDSALPGDAPAFCDVGPTDCDLCLTASCCQQVLTCQVDPTCDKMLACVVACEQGGGNAMTCSTSGPCSKGHDQISTDLLTCESQMCNAICASQ
jgi:hypothetical protein